MNISSFLFCVYFLPETAAVVWEETQPTLHQEMDSYHFSSPEVVIAATSMNKCDAAVQEIYNNKKVFKEPVKIKTYARAQVNIGKARYNGENRAENEEGKQDGNGHVEIVKQGGTKILTCQNGRLSSTQEAIKEEATKRSSNARLTERMQAKQKCFGKQLTERRLKKIIPSIDHQSRAQNDHKMKQKYDNLEFGFEDGDTNVTAADDVNVEEKSFTRLRSVDSGSRVPEIVRSTGNKEPSLKAVKSAPMTRAQKRNIQGTPQRSLCENIPQNEPDALSNVAGERMSNEEEKKKIIKTSQETPVKPSG